MQYIINRVMRRRFLGFAVLLAFCLTLLFPAIASAQAILLYSNPANDSVLSIAPKQVHMLYSEALNPAFSTAVVVNGQNKRVDNRDAHVSSGDQTEMDMTLQPNLPPAVYIVIWRTDSAADGHILRGSFHFSVANADGTVPTLAPGANPGAKVLGGGNLTSQNTGQFDGPTLFNLIMITLVELGAIFWMGAQLWINFVLSISSESHAEERNTNERVQRRFERYFSLPTLIVLFLANIGVLVGQALNLTRGDLAQAISPALLVGLATSGRFGIYWMMREVVILLAMILAVYMIFEQQHSRIAKTVLPIANLVLASALLIALTMSGHAAAVNPDIVSYAIIIDWLHLLAASLWVGGILYIATNYLPVLKRLHIPEQARSLVTVLPYFTPLVLAGVLIMAVTGPFNAAFHLTSWQQLVSTAYGRALLVKIALIGGLLVTSTIHVGLLRPRLKKEYQKYRYAANRLQVVQSRTETAEQIPPTTLNGQQAVTKTAEPGRATKLLAQQVRIREERLTKKTQVLSRVLRWESVLGIGILICAGLMDVFAGTLSPIAVAQPQQQQSGNQPQAFTTTAPTKDGTFKVTLSVNPNHFGTNVFTVSAIDTATGKPATNIGVSLYTTMLDMDMGTDTITLQPDGKGHFSGTGELSMPGNWEIRIVIHTPDGILHETSVKLVTPF